MSKSYFTITKYRGSDSLSDVDMSRDLYLSMRGCMFGDEYYLHYSPLTFGDTLNDGIDSFTKVCSEHIRIYSGSEEISSGFIYIQKYLAFHCCDIVTVKVENGDIDTAVTRAYQLVLERKCERCHEISTPDDPPVDSDPDTESSQSETDF